MAVHREQKGAPVNTLPLRRGGLRRQAIGVAIGLLAILTSGCAVTDPGYGGVGVWPGYYEPYGAAYGGWGPGFLVGPVGGGGYRGGRGGFGGQHAFRAPTSRSAPSIPGARGGGARGGGGRGGGGHGGGHR
jgi:hypothetical protein